MDQTKSITLVTAHIVGQKKCFLKFSQLDTSFRTIMSLVMSRFNNLNWDEVFNKKKNMTGVKISLNN